MIKIDNYTTDELIENNIKLRANQYVLNMILKGYSKGKIINSTSSKFEVSKSEVEFWYYEVKNSLNTYNPDSLESTVSIHVSRYEKLYNEAVEAGLDRTAMRILKQKERLLAFQSEVYNKILLATEDVFENPYNFETLNDSEKNTLFSFFKRNGIDKNNYEQIEKFNSSLEKEVYRKSYYRFFLKAYAQLHPNEPFSDNWHVKYLCDRIQKEIERINASKPRKKHLIINIPFRTGKSLITNVVANAWAWTINPRLKILIASSSKDIAIELSDQFATLINSDWYQSLYGKDYKINPASNSKVLIKTLNGGIRKSVGRGTKITGTGFDLIFLDDILDAQEAQSDVKINAANNYFTKSLYSRLNNPDVGSHIIVQQRLTQRDISGTIQSDPKYSQLFETIRIPGTFIPELIEPKELIKYYKGKNYTFHPQRFSLSTYENFKINLGTVSFENQVNQRSFDPEGGEIKRDWFKIIDYKDIYHNFNTHPPQYFIDTAYGLQSKSSRNDPTAICSCFSPDGINLYIFHCDTYNKTLPEFNIFLKSYLQANKYKPGSVVWIEPKASGHSILQSMKSEGVFKVKPIETSFVRSNKIQRISACTPLIEAGRVYLIGNQKDQEPNGWIFNFLNELSSFNSSTGFKGHDDRADVFAYAAERMILLNKKSFFTTKAK